MYLVIPQHSKAARRDCVPRDLHIAPKTASSLCKEQLKVVQTGLTASMEMGFYISKALS